MKQSLILTFSILIANGLTGIRAQLSVSENFINDAIAQWAANDPVFILQGDLDLPNIKLAQNIMANFVTYDSNNVEEILTYLK